MRLASLALVAASLLGVSARSAEACINDRETPNQEREFRSDYGEPGSDRGQPAPISPGQMAHWPTSVLTGLGAALLTGAGFLAVQSRSKG